MKRTNRNDKETNMTPTIIAIVLSLSINHTVMNNLAETIITHAKDIARTEAVACDPRPKQVIPDSQTGLGIDETTRFWVPDKN